MIFLLPYLVASALLIWSCHERGRAAGMSSERMAALAWAASAVGMAVAFGTHFLLLILLTLLVSAEEPDTLGPVWKGAGYAYGVSAQHRAGLRLIPPIKLANEHPGLTARADRHSTPAGIPYHRYRRLST